MTVQLTPSPVNTTPKVWGSYLAPSGSPWLSVSQIEMFAGCERKWGIRYLKKIRTPPSPAAAVGTRVHEIAEAYLKNRTRPNLAEYMDVTETNQFTQVSKEVRYYPGQIFQAGIHLLPAPGSVNMLAEGAFRFPTQVTGEPIYWQGALDMEYYKEALPTVGDHKTSKNPKAYGKTAEPLDEGWEADEERRKYAKKITPGRLLADPQFNLYSYHIQEKAKVDRNSGLWVYYDTIKHTAHKIQVVGERQIVHYQVAKIEAKARRALQMYRDKPNPDDMEPNPRFCSAFGGCAYKNTEHCKLHMQELLGEEAAMSTSDFMSFVSSMTAGTPSVVPPPPPAPPMMAPPPPPPPAIVAAPPPPAPIFANVDAEALDVVRSLLTKQGHSPELVEERMGMNRPAVEAGFINPPEAAGLTAVASPEELAPVSVSENTNSVALEDLDVMDRDALKRLAVNLGVCETSSRFGEAKLRELIRARRVPTTGGGTPAVDEPKPITVAELAEAVDVKECFAAYLTPSDRTPTLDEIRVAVREELLSFFARLGK